MMIMISRLMYWFTEMKHQLGSKSKKSRSTLVSKLSWLLSPMIFRIRKVLYIIMFRSYGDALSQTVRDIVKAKGYDKVIASTSAFGKDVVPRLGGLLDVQPITDVI